MEERADLSMVRKSVEYRICVRGIFAFGGLFIIVASALGIITLLTMKAVFMLVIIPTAIVFSLYLLCAVGRMHYYVKNFDNCIIKEAVLTNPQAGFNATIYFVAKIKNQELNAWFEVQTNNIGATRGLIRPHFSELTDKKVSVAYNEYLNEVIVLKY